MAQLLQTSKLAKMRRTQEVKGWDIDRDLDWGCHTEARPLLPLGEDLERSLGLSCSESLALSQLLGLMAINAISEHERAIQYVKEACWSQPLRRRNLGQDYRDLGEQFFADEAKHSRAFARYIERFADRHGVPYLELLEILPSYKDSWVCRFFRWNSKLGGRAVWWLVMLTEEESLQIYRQIRPHKSEIDPLFYQLHKLHFQEEIRHISYAPLMLRKLGEPRCILQSWIGRFDYVFAMAMHFLWIGQQLRRVGRARGLRKQHPFFGSIASVFDKLDALPLRKRWQILFFEVPFLSDLFRPARHRAVRIEWKRNRDFSSLPNLFNFLRS